MKYCTHCGAELLDAAIICPSCFSAVEVNKTENKSSRSSNSSGWSGLAIAGFIVSFFNGIAGLIMSIVGLQRTRSCGNKGSALAIAGIVISAVHLAIVLIDSICWVILIYLIM